jgi:tetratricopeptide (TPR) repeat protein
LTLTEKLLSESKYDLAKATIDEAAENEQTKDNFRTWYLRAFTYRALFKAANNSKDAVSADAGKFRITAIESARKSIALDKNKELSKDCYTIVNSMRISMVADASLHYKNKNDKAALAQIEEYIQISKSFENAEEDAQAYFIAGISAFRMADYPRSDKYLNRAESLGNTDAALYVYLAKSLWLLGKKPEAIKVLERGFEKHSKNKELVSTLYEYNRELGRFAENQQMLQKAANLSPGEADFWILLAINFEDIAANAADQAKNDLLDKAKEAYLKALAIRPNDDFANSNLGILLYNQGVNMLNSADLETSLPDIVNIQRRALSKFKEAEPYMLKAYELNPNRKETLYGLEIIYYVMGEFEKSNKYKLLRQQAEKE